MKSIAKSARVHLASTSAVAALMAIAMATPAAAQTAPAPAAPVADAAQPADQGGTDVVVTGSRVTSNGNNSPTPVTVALTSTLLEAQPAGVVQGLNNLPGLLGSLNTTSNANTGGFNTLNLRGIGATRALIMLDGQRVGPTQSNATIDVDVIPQMLMKRVDVVTGGASAVYGSDAVSGVVNFITDTRFLGLKADAQIGISNYGDDRKVKLGLAWGTKLGDRGHFEAAYEYNDAPGFNRSDRPFLTPNQTMQGSVLPVGGVFITPGTAKNPYVLVNGATLSTASFGGLITSGPLAGLQFANNGQLSTFNTGSPTGTSGTQIGGDGGYYVGATAAASQRIHRALARFDYDLTDDVHAHAQGVFATFTQGYTQQNPLLSGVTIGYNNPFLQSVQSNYLAIINAQPTTGSFKFGKVDTALAPYRLTAKENYFMAGGGLDGKVGGFSWEANYYHTDSSERITNASNINTTKFYAALNAVTNPANGQIVCNAALANPSVYGSCVPINVFGPTAEQQAAINYVTQSTSATYRFVTNDVNATLKGDLFRLPAGPVKVAFNGEYRHQNYSVASNASPFDTVNCTGIQFNCTATSTPYFVNQVSVRAPIGQTVYEGAAEADVPLLADKPFFKAVNLNLAGRYTHYNTSGGVWTWKAGLVWNVSDELTLRGTRSRDIRAPTLVELYGAPTLTLRNYTDNHTSTPGTVNSVAQGNPNLIPEKADTLTLGVVLKPHFIPGFSLAIDYYRITINQAIVAVDAFQPATQAQCEASGGTDPVCALYVRPLAFSNTTAANYPTLLYNQNLNVASLKTHGIDFELNYHTLIGSHNLTLRGLLNYQPQLLYNNGPNGIVDVGGAADGVGGLPPIPKVKIVASAAYDLTDSVRVLVQERWRSKLAQNGSTALYFVTGPVPSVGYTDFNLNFKVNDKFSAFLNVQNLFNTKPLPFASSGGSTQPNYLGGFAQGDDIEGRFFTFGVRLTM